MPVVKGKITVVATIEDGDLMYWRGSGPVWEEKDEDYFQEGGDVEEWIDSNPDIRQLMNQGATFTVTFQDVVIDYEAPVDDANGFDPGGAWLVCNGDHVILEVYDD